MENCLLTPPEKSYLTADKDGNRVLHVTTTSGSHECPAYTDVYIARDKIDIHKHYTDYGAGCDMNIYGKVNKRSITDIDLVNPLKKKFDTEKQRRDKEDARLYKEILDKESSQNLSPVAAKLKKFQRD